MRHYEARLLKILARKSADNKTVVNELNSIHTIARNLKGVMISCYYNKECNHEIFTLSPPTLPMPAYGSFTLASLTGDGDFDGVKVGERTVVSMGTS